MNRLKYLLDQAKLSDEEIQLQYIADLRHAIEYANTVIEMSDRYYKLHNFGKSALDAAKASLAKSLADTRHNRAKEWLTPVQYRVYTEYTSRVRQRRAKKNATI